MSRTTTHVGVHTRATNLEDSNMTTTRERATARYRLAAATLDSVFDLTERLVACRAELASLAGSPADDLVDNTVSVLASAAKLSATLDALRAAAVDALEYTTQRQLASDLGTRQGVLFPPSPAPLPAPASTTADTIGESIGESAG